MKVKDAFLTSVLGADGRRAVLASVKKNASLDTWVYTRSIVAWLNTIEDHHCGTIPGSTIPVVLIKADDTDTWSGGVQGSQHTEHYSYVFEDAAIAHVAAMVALNLACQPFPEIDFRDINMARLGKTIDSLAKATAKGGASGSGVHAAPIPPNEPHPPTDKAPERRKTRAVTFKLPRLGQKIKSKPVAKPTTTGASEAPKPATTGASEAPKPATTGAKLTLSEKDSRQKCTICLGQQIRDGSFVGCHCFRALAKSVTVNTNRTGTITLTFGAEWDDEAIETLSESLGGQYGRRRQ